MATIESAALSAAVEQGFEDIDVRVRPLDQRLRPAQCDQQLDIVRPHAGRALGPVSYGVRCAGSVPWTLYLRADVSAAMLLPVLARALPRGALIGVNDLSIKKQRITSRDADFIVDPKLAEGMELKRALPAGSTLRYGHVALPRLVARGQTVTLVAGTGGLQVRMQGKAMANGAEGDHLMVTNSNSGKRIEGVVLRDGSVRIP
ncbi:MAG: flagellar basal body P-ring formation chaperone FlgA [Congregibacter sp.]